MDESLNSSRSCRQIWRKSRCEVIQCVIDEGDEEL